MKVTVDRLPGSTVRLSIVADAKEFSTALEQAYRRISRQVQVPGFRPGRAPRALVERRVGREFIVAEAQRDLMEQLYQKAVQEHALLPISSPTVQIQDEEPFSFQVEVQVYPDVVLDGYRDLRVEPREVSVTEEEVDQVLEQLRRNQAVWRPPSEPRYPQNGDQVIVDIEAFDGEQLFQEPLRNATFLLGESNLFEELSQAIRSLLPGEETRCTITFAEDDERVNPELRGKTLNYRIVLHEIKEAELPAPDDEFARTFGVESLTTLREHIARDLAQQKVQAARSEVLETAIERLVELANVDLPPALIDRQVAMDLERLRERLRQQGTSLEEFLRFQGKTLEEFAQELRPQAEARLRRYLVLEEFARAEGIVVSEEELEEEIERLAVASGRAEEFRQAYQVPAVRSYLADELQGRKVSERLLEIVTEGRGPVVGEALALLSPSAGTGPAREGLGSEEALQAREEQQPQEETISDSAVTSESTLTEQAETRGSHGA